MDNAEGQSSNSSTGSFSIWHKIIFFFIFYIISPGPVLYLLGTTGIYNHNWVNKCFFYFYFPHAVLAFGFKPYQAYVLWWFEVSGVPIF
jgi:hypothetical protein